ELALVVVLPKNVWSCDRPGWPGKTIGSSGAVWLKRQRLTKLTSSKPAIVGATGAFPPATAPAPAMASATRVPAAAASALVVIALARDAVAVPVEMVVVAVRRARVDREVPERREVGAVEIDRRRREADRRICGVALVPRLAVGAAGHDRHRGG